jgi:protein-export membrane protein SecD
VQNKPPKFDIIGGGNNDAQNEKDMMQKALDTLRVRLNETGLKEPSVQQQGKDLINVQFPGVDDPSRIKDILGRTAKLSFHLVDETLSQTYNQSIRLPASKMALSMKPEGDAMPMVLVLERRAMVTGEMLSSASTSFQDGLPVVAIRFNTVGAKRFGQATAENVNRRFAIVLDQEIISAPVIRDAIPGGNAVMSGGFTADSAGDLALLLRSGSLPLTLMVIEERTVGPSMGEENIKRGVHSTLWGFAAIAVMMMIYYNYHYYIYNKTTTTTTTTIIITIITTITNSLLLLLLHSLYTH